MFKSALIVALCFAAALAYPANTGFDVIEDDEGQQFYLVPVDDNQEQEHGRYRRQAAKTSAQVGSDGLGVSHTGTILNSDRHRLDGTAFAQKDFANHGPLTTGGQLDYTHKPSQSTASLAAQNTRHFGTDLTARGTYNAFQSRDGRTSAGVSAEYSRHFGGMGGSRRPDYGAFAHFTHRF